MRAVIQRVSQASVMIDKKIKSSIKDGLLVFWELKTQTQQKILNGLLEKFPTSEFLMMKMG